MHLEFANRPDIIVERKTQYLSHNLQLVRGGGCNTPPVTSSLEIRARKLGDKMTPTNYFWGSMSLS